MKEHICKLFLNWGVKGYLCKTINMEAISQAFKIISLGEIYFPPSGWSKTKQTHAKKKSHQITLRQQDVLNLLASGYSNKAIADKLLLKESTVKRHLYNLYQSLGVKNRVEALQFAHQQGLVIPAE